MISTALVCLTVLALAHFYVCPRIDTWMDKRYDKPATMERVTIPHDLIAWANDFGQQWAIDDARNFLLEEYERLKDWNAVRASAQART